MISVIICSNNPKLLSKVSVNIQTTIGVPYELIAIDNRNTYKGICQVYNEAAEKAKFDYLCFVHEDVIFHSAFWGKEICWLLSKNDIGLVGISGAVYKSQYPATWSACDASLYRTNSIQHFKEQSMPIYNYINPAKEAFSEVVLIDGVFMTTRKSIWSENKFDAFNFRGFHCYDLDWSFTIRKHYKVIVSHKILLEHFSEGDFNQEWLYASLLLHRKWKNLLPLHSEYLSTEVISKSNYIAISSILNVLLKHRGFKLLVTKNYLKLILLFWKQNNLKFSKSVLHYLLEV